MENSDHGSFAEDEETFSVKLIKTKLKERYKKKHFFSEKPGKSTKVCLKDVGSNIISDQKYRERKQHMQEGKRRVIAAAASLIRSEVRNVKHTLDVYP